MIKILNIQDKNGCELMHGHYDVLAELSDNCTNGDMIMTMFPNLRVTIYNKAKPTPYVTVMGENYEFNNTYPLDWWNAPYKAESEGDE